MLKEGLFRASSATASCVALISYIHVAMPFTRYSDLPGLRPTGQPSLLKFVPDKFVGASLFGCSKSLPAILSNRRVLTIPTLVSYILLNGKKPIQKNMAERQGFEPWDGLTRRRFSRPVLSTTQPPLRRFLGLIKNAYLTHISPCFNATMK